MDSGDFSLGEATVPGRRRQSDRWPAALLAAVLLASWLATAWMPLFDPDEGYYPAAAAETRREGAFWDIRFNAAPRWDKPVLSYALIEASFALLGEDVLAARLPSALEGAMLVLLVAAVVGRLGTRRAGFLSALVVGTTLGVSIFARVAHPEIAVVLSVITTELLVCLWLTTRGPRRRLLAVAAGVSVGLGLLAKGPVAAVLPVLALVVCLPWVARREDAGDGFRDALVAGLVALGIAAPWYVAMTFRHGPAFLQQSLWQQNVGRYTTDAYHHRAGALSLLLPAVAAMLPWCAFLPQAVARLRIPDDRPVCALRVMMASGAATALVFYSMSSSKLASYTLVCVPPLGILVGLLLDDALDGRTRVRRSALASAVMFGILALALAAWPVLAGHFLTNRRLLGGLRPPSDDPGRFFASLVLPASMVLAGAAAAVAWARRPARVVAAIAILGIVLPLTILAAARPLLATIYPWAGFGATIAADSAPVFIVGRRAPSLTFYSRRAIAFVEDPGVLAERMRPLPECWVVMTEDQWRKSRAEPEWPERTHVAGHAGRMLLIRRDDPGRVEHASASPRQTR